ncbi:hypothetical protein OSTOST_25415, partial [Ostertagia ostertagi]
LFLSDEQIERIHSFEEECIEDMEREKDIRKQSSNDERIHRTAERSDQILNSPVLTTFIPITPDEPSSSRDEHRWKTLYGTDVRNLDMVLKTMESR